MSHLEEGTIHAWLDGALPPDEALRVEAHARECAQCAAMVAEARGFIAGASRIASSLDVVRGNVIPATSATSATSAPPAARNSLWKRLKLTPARAAIAATILVGVASMFSVRHRDLQSPQEAAVAASAPVAERAVVAPSAPVARPPVDSGRSLQRATKPSAAANAASVPTTGVPAESKVAAVPPIAATPEPAQPAARVSSAFDRVAPRVAGSTPQAAVASGAEGCYVIARRVGDPDLSPFPVRFQLARDSSSANIVRPMTFPGRAGAPIDAATWRLLPGNSVFITVQSSKSPGIDLQFVVGDTILRRADGGPHRPVRLDKVGCGS